MFVWKSFGYIAVFGYLRVLQLMLKVPNECPNKPQAMPLVQIGGQDDPDRQCLVNNYSVNSFLNDNNELTVTRSFERKYSTMHFKPTEKNRVDIVVTHGEYLDSNKGSLHLRNFSSQDIRRENHVKAKCLLIAVFALLFLMLGILLVFIFRASGAGNEHPNYEKNNAVPNDIGHAGYIIPALRNTTSVSEINTTVPSGQMWTGTL